MWEGLDLFTEFRAIIGRSSSDAGSYSSVVDERRLGKPKVPKHAKSHKAVFFSFTCHSLSFRIQQHARHFMF